MFRNRRFVGILVVALILVATVSGVALATTDPAGNTTKATLYQDFLAKFSANLGVDQDKVAAALETTKKQLLDEAVQQGRLTQEQADRMASRADVGPGLFGGFHGKKNGGKHDFMMPGRGLEDMAKALDTTTEQLQSEFKAGKKMTEIIADHGLTAEQFHQKMLELKKEALAAAVSEGKMTQDQADKMIQRMEQGGYRFAPKTGN